MNNGTITVEQLYNYAIQHNYLDTSARVVLDIIDRESNHIGTFNTFGLGQNNLVSPANNTSTLNFDNLVEYSIEDLLTLLSL